MNRKLVLIVLLMVILASVIGYFAFFNDSTPYTSQEECEEKTGKQCFLFKGLCQVAMAQNQKEAIENEKFMKDCTKKIGTWQPIETVSPNN